MHSVHSHLHERIHGDDEELQSSVHVKDQRDVCAGKVHRTIPAAASISTSQEEEDALCHILEQTVKDLVALFNTSQVQVCDRL